jgi:hypothetical protein
LSGQTEKARLTPSIIGSIFFPSGMEPNIHPHERGSNAANASTDAPSLPNFSNLADPAGNSSQPASLLDESPETREAKARFTERFESLRRGYKKAVKSPNGFLAGLVFAEAKNARDAGNFTAAQDMLGELEEVIQLAEKKSVQQAVKAGERFKTDYKTLERKARWEGGSVLQSASRHLKAAREFADKKDFTKATRVLQQLRTLLEQKPKIPAG